MINTAIVGLGWWGSHIVNTLQDKSHKIRFLKAVDIEKESKLKFAKSNGIEITSDFDSVLADSSIEAVVLATPHSKHEEQTF